ncbi:MAG: hypothetical protein Q4C53_03085 [Clostridia bacterium]|nr:hypothetical protein [Clostridia bacterium]
MKKILATVLALLLALSMTAFAASAELAGEWYGETLAMGEESMELAALGMSVTLSLNEDGTVVFALADEDPATGTWTEDNGAAVVTIDGDSVPFVLNEEGKLVADMEGVVFTFGRESGAAAPAFVRPEPVKAELADFNGTWQPVYMSDGSMYFSLETMASIIGQETVDLLAAPIPIENGTLTFLGMGVDMVYEDGMLKGPEGVDVAMSATMLEGGILEIELNGSYYECVLAG